VNQDLEDLGMPRRCLASVAMLQTHFPMLELKDIALVGPKGPNDKEIKPDANFEKVMPFASVTEQDCHLKKLLDGVETPQMK
jgi:hypothetical protein